LIFAGDVVATYATLAHITSVLAAVTTFSLARSDRGAATWPPSPRHRSRLCAAAARPLSFWGLMRRACCISGGLRVGTGAHKQPCSAMAGRNVVASAAARLLTDPVKALLSHRLAPSVPTGADAGNTSQMPIRQGNMPGRWACQVAKITCRLQD